MKLRTQRAERYQYGMTILTGHNVIHELEEFLEPITLFYTGGDDPPMIADNFPQVISVTESVMSKISGLDSVNSRTLVAKVKLPETVDFLNWPKGTIRRLLVLEKCQDPGNLGTLLRTAVACDWDGVILLPGCADPFNEKALRASRGACFKIPIQYGTHKDWRNICEFHNIVRLAAELEHRGEWYSKDADASNLIEINAGDSSLYFNSKVSGLSLVLGSEGSGLSDESLQGSKKVAIPMAGDMESLNIASAGSILMWLLGETGGTLLTERDDDMQHI